uniref:Uncharacterized protein n=1 Tax=Branchiostoma floridae TaxID=7739 RepID=C3XZZ9_BRAFL|eukprot:XP_002610355.1 hypothetical protein BRAFLDRAFT_72443 [Branchiostoma floridae]
MTPTKHPLPNTASRRKQTSSRISAGASDGAAPYRPQKAGSKTTDVKVLLPLVALPTTSQTPTTSETSRTARLMVTVTLLLFILTLAWVGCKKDSFQTLDGNLML